MDPNDDYIPVGKCTVRGYDAVQLVKSMRETYFRQVAATSGGASNAAAAGTVDQDSLAYKLHAVSSRDSLVPANAIHLSVKPVVETRSSIQTGLFAVSAVRPGQLLIECKGELVRKSDYLATLDQQQRDAATGYAQQTSLPPGIAERFVHFHPALDLAVDARRIGNEARFVRYSCRPNARARSTIVTGATDASDIIHLCLYAEKAIGAGEEVTLAYDVEMGAAEYGKLALDCACADYYACGFNVNRKPLAKEKVEREMKMTVVVEVPAVERRSSVSPTAMDVDQAHGATKPPRARSPSAARPPSRVQTTQQPRQDTVTTDDVVLSDTDAADSGEERIPDTPTYDQQQLLSPTSGFLSREERKIRDELARFARMEKQREEKAKARRASSNKVAAGAGGGDGNESSASEKMTSKGGGKRGRGADRGSAASSRQSSAPSSPVSKAPLFLKRMWVQRYAAEQRNQLASVSERAGTAAGTGSSTPSISDTVSLLGSATVSNESLAVSPVRSEMQVERPPSTTIIVTAASVEDSRPVSPIQVDVTASSSVAPSAGHSPVHTNPAKRSAPPDEREEIEAAAASSMTVDTIDSTSATTTAVEPGASPTTVATTRISFKDYKKKRKIMQEQEQTPVSGDAGASAAPSAAVSPVRSEVPPTHGDNSQPVKSTDAPPSDLPTPPDATTKTDSTYLSSPRRPSPTRAASASRSPRRASSRSVSPRPPSSTH